MSRGLIKTLFVLIAVGLVGLAFSNGSLDRELARWKLAAAANALEQEKFDEVDRFVEEARRLHPQIEREQDYWYVQILQAYLQNDYARVVELAQQAVEQSPRFKWLAEQMATRLADEEQFALAAQLLELTIEDRQRASPVQLNTLAYWRALAGVDLDQALADINLALKHAPDDPAMRDTRAWVLFQMGRPVEALEDADFAVKAMEQQMRAFTSLWDRVAQLLEDRQNDRPEDGDEVAGQENGREPTGTTTQTDEPAKLDEPAEPTGADSPDAPDPQAEQIPEPAEDRFPWDIPRPPQPRLDAPSLRLRQSVDPALWNLAVLRYHRARILEALGREAEAEKDFQWLRRHNLPTDDRLY